MLRPASTRATVLTAASCLTASIAFADVTITFNGTADGIPGAGTLPATTTYLKGAQQRVDRGPTSTIIGLDTDRVTIIDHDARAAVIYALADLQPRQPERIQARVDVEVTDSERRFGDVVCHAARVSLVRPNVSLPGVRPPFERQREVTTGVVWLATDGPGADEYRRFNRRLADVGAIVTDFEMARLDSAGAVTQARFSTAIAVEGIPCASQLSSVSLGTLDDTQALVPSHSMGWQIRSVSVEPLDDTLFEVPPGYETVSTLP